MIEFLDIFYTFIHLALIFFNILGWIWPQTRKAHFISILITLAFWLLAGFWYGLGYCPLTDWQWQVKHKLGESDLPNSFIKYIADKITGIDISPSLADGVSLGIFLMAFLISVYVNFFRKNSFPKQKRLNLHD